MELATKIFAFLGGLTGPLGLLIAWLTYRRDKAHLRVTLSRGYVVRSKDDAEIRFLLKSFKYSGQDPPMSLYARDPDKDWAYIEVTNIGRRKVYVEKIAWVPENVRTGFYVPSGFMGDASWLPAELAEGDSKTFPIEEKNLADGVLAVCAWDRTGRGYYGSFKRSWRGFILRLKVMFRIRPYR